LTFLGADFTTAQSGVAGAPAHLALASAKHSQQKG
jgi:hypothetical protein